jgi:hypothetical protein
MGAQSSVSSYWACSEVSSVSQILKNSFIFVFFNLFHFHPKNTCKFPKHQVYSSYISCVVMLKGAHMSKSSTSPMSAMPLLTSAQTLARAQKFAQTNFFPNLQLAPLETTIDESTKRTARVQNHSRPLSYPLLSLPIPPRFQGPLPESSEPTGALSASVGAELRPSESITFPPISLPLQPNSRPLWERISPASRSLSFIQEPIPSSHTADPRSFTLPGNLIPQILATQHVDTLLIVFVAVHPPALA